MAAVIGTAAAAGPAVADGPPTLPYWPPPTQAGPNADTDALLRDTIQRLVEALGQVLQDVPRYAPPEIDENGNIILRRLNPPGPPLRPRRPPDGATLDQTSA